ELTAERVRLGSAALGDVLAVQTQVERTRAQIPLLRDQLQQNEHLLAVLIGREPGAGGLPSFTLEDFELPRELPLVLPSDLVRKRPDILGAEALLHAASAEYGVAVSRLYPQLTLSSDLGSQALTIGGLFDSGSSFWSMVGQLTQPLFSPGLPAEKRAALAALEAAAANYQSVVLESLRGVADVLRALENDSERLAALTAADTASRKALDSTRRTYALGAVGYYDLLVAQQQRQETQFDLIEGQAKRLLNSVAFFQATGGGIIYEDAAAASLQ
ncbi:MAG: efflux transporter outer membrane subunit, partial [Proteobacteria bacterium]|nr:efflux transporter outer membrane subunit [Pseudomonadota bacterium]